jgi:outer membrane protein assembly factor BamB
MSQDFTTTLGRQLREAAEREATRGRLRVRPPARRTLVVAAALLIAAAFAVAAVSLFPRREVPANEKAPHIVAHVAVTDHGGDLSAAFGSLWTYDSIKSQVLRLSTDGAVTATIPIPGNIDAGAAGDGAMWAMTDSQLYRVDPRTNRIVARVPLPPPSRSFGLGVDTGAVWIGDGSRLIHLDSATNRFGRPIDIEHGGQASRGTAGGPGRIYVLRSDGQLEIRDGHTGRRLSVARPAVENSPLLGFADSLLVPTSTGVAAIDPGTGRLRWNAPLGTSEINGAAYGLGALWIQGTPASGRDRLWKLDPRSGRVLGTLTLSDFGATGMVIAGGSLWIASPSGNLTAIR